MEDKAKVINTDQKQTLHVKTANGETIDCEVLFRYRKQSIGRNYVVYTDGAVTEEGRLKVYAAYNDDTDLDTKLKPVRTAQELQEIMGIMADISKKKEAEKKAKEAAEQEATAQAEPADGADDAADRTE